MADIRILATPDRFRLFVDGVEVHRIKSFSFAGDSRDQDDGRDVLRLELEIFADEVVIQADGVAIETTTTAQDEAVPLPDPPSVPDNGE